MENNNLHISGKKARARRSLIMKENCSKRQRQNCNQPDSINDTFYSPNCFTMRQPLSEITPSAQNQKTIAQIVEEGIMLSARMQNSEPSITRHVFRNNMKSSHLDSLGTNLMSKFSTDCTNENGHPTTIENAQHGVIFSTNQFYDPGSSSKNPINTEKKKPICGRPKKQLGVPSLAMNLNSNPPNEAVNISVAQQPTSDSDEDSDYDPFATYLSDENFCSEPEDNEAPFTIHDNYTRSSEAYYDIGDPLIECRYCKSMMWYQERMNKISHSANPKFMLCCCNGKVEIPLLKQPPEVLAKLMFDQDNVVSRKYQQHIRVYNMMFAFTSPGAKLDNRFNNGGGPPTLRIQGQTCHQIGSLLPSRRDTPKFAQLYIYDTENEVPNRMKCLRTTKNIDPEVVQQLSTMMYEHNTHVKSFKMAKQWFNEADTQNLKLRLIADRSTDGRVYNQPTVSEVAALVVGDIDTAEMRDIIMQYQGGGLKRINELHASYMAFQYPLIFPYGEDGYRPNIAHRDLPIYQNSLRNRLTIREWLSYRIQTRLAEPKTLLSSRRLFQQFLVNGYTMLESEKLEWIRKNQPKLRVSKYNSVNDEGEQSQIAGSSIGKRVVLPSSFVGGRRFMDQLYYDGMAICSKIGFPDLLITFTCNPNWPEIHRVLGPLHLKPQDRPDVVSRIFKIKFDQLLANLTKNGVLGKVLAYMYTIEFQKRGLPHAHILLFLHPSNKYPRPEDIDRIISAEVPDPLQHPRLYNLVKSHMVHGPCGLAN
ncbi:uncharacterized protein LOC131649912 [Vicia villosa]|uniref:uncharacterized protein LOC131649912 n=1 Tax=Vicia villosa TaxID=3911 RepID=UPI00273A794C|nr:uncharacterized protein LOC131649912 [Vicia villosa]